MTIKKNHCIIVSLYSRVCDLFGYMKYKGSYLFYFHKTLSINFKALYNKKGLLYESKSTDNMHRNKFLVNNFVIL